jgi:alkanesulfonate monooxygenase SsuD/methylene tetrahydromethanopterin reductase-like flavin-dependent oxidoreductase (luciferase family)
LAGPLGLILPTFPQDSDELISAAALAETCRRAEDAGATALWACDHLFWHRPVLECLGALGVAALATRRAALGSCVLQLPLRHAPAVAKEAATLQHLSAGRFILGVGVGSHEGEYQADGSDFHTRGHRLDEGMAVLREAWEAGDDHYRQRPTPTPIPLWVGGSSEAALRRAAHLADGWIPLFLSPAEYAAATTRLAKEAERSGRDPETITRAITCFVSLGGPDATDRGLRWLSSLYGLPPKAFARHIVAGSTEHCAEALTAWVEAGAQHVSVFVAADDPLIQFEELAGALARALGRPMLDDVRGPDTGKAEGTA